MRRGTLITGAVVGVLVVGSAVGATAAVVSLQKAQAETNQVGSAQLQAVASAPGETSQASRAVKPLVAPKLKVPAKKKPIVITRTVPVPATGGSNAGQSGQGSTSPDSWVSSDGQSGNAAPAGGQSGGGGTAGNAGGGSDSATQGEVEDSSSSSEGAQQEKPETPEPAQAPEKESGNDD